MIWKLIEVHVANSNGISDIRKSRIVINITEFVDVRGIKSTKVSKDSRNIKELEISK